MFALAAEHQTNQISEYLNGAASVNSDESVIKEKICENLWENIFSSCIRDNPCSLYYRVLGSLPQITRIYTDVGAKDVEKICENPWHLWENIAQDASVIIRVRFIIGSKGDSHRLRGSTRMWVRRMLKKSVRIRGICGRT